MSRVHESMNGNTTTEGAAAAVVMTRDLLQQVYCELVNLCKLMMTDFGYTFTTESRMKGECLSAAAAAGQPSAAAAV